MLKRVKILLLLFFIGLFFWGCNPFTLNDKSESFVKDPIVEIKKTEEEKLKKMDCCLSENKDNCQMSFDRAREIAVNSDCVEEGFVIANKCVFDKETKTFLFDMAVDQVDEKDCSLVCVVNENTAEVEISQRCD